mgnify:FL=1
MKNIEKATNNMKMVYSILCNLKKCTIFELQKLTKFRDVDLCLALGYLLQNNQIYQKRIDNMVTMESSQNEKIYNRFTTHFAYMLAWCFLIVCYIAFYGM